MKVPPQTRHTLNNDIKRTAKDSFIYLPSRVIPAITGILLIRVLTTLFTPEEYGFYQITLSTFGLIRVFSMVWVSSSVTRFFLSYKNKSKQNIFYSTLFICSVIGAVVVVIVSFFINRFYFFSKIDAELYHLINIAIAASFFTALFETFIVVFRAGLEAKKYSLFWILFSVGKPLLGIALILLFGFRVDGIFWAFLVIPFILEIIIFTQIGLFQSLAGKNFSHDLAKQFLRYGLPITMSFLAFWILSLSDRYLIEYFQSTSQVGFYSVGYVISEKTLNFLYMILMLAAYPIIVDSWEKHGKDYTQHLISELTRIFFIICIPFLVILVTLPDHVLLVFASDKFIKGANVLPLIAIGVFFNGLNQYVLKSFELQKKSYKIAGLAFFAGSTNIIANIILIPRLGYVGAGVSACLAYIVYFLSGWFFARKELAFRPPLYSITKIVLAGTIAGFFMSIVADWIQKTLFVIILVIPAGLLLFIGALFLLKELKKQDMIEGWNYLLRFVRK